ncbi:AraC family two component transcriptional regulator [Hypnocyclicus thermotrophus]|uniref:AraC family two component transcriptional regulator n=1 Tax=Hypnocyclicus thermotrophus TaxID=1627895 RepID=A0AA46DYW6_9FUSO|nr:response regulator [Hypnocyclicus thermotrophus]TDT70455.1 AraC family two component transcriptional regulator [Hypnocyclicus thermotrophus]
MKKILVVDDEKFIRLGIATILENNFIDLDIKLAKNGKEALEIIEKEEFEIIITDINMPTMNGMELLKEVNKLDKKIKTIILSGFNEFEYARQSIQYGVKNYLLKPIDEKELRDNIYEIFNEIEKENQNKKKDFIKDFLIFLERKKYNKIEKLLIKLKKNIKNLTCYYIETTYNINSLSDIVVNINENQYIILSEKEIDFSDIEYNFLCRSKKESIKDSFNEIEKLKKYKIFFEKENITYENIKNRKKIEIDNEKIDTIYNYLKYGKIKEIEKEINSLFNDKFINNGDIESFEKLHNLFYLRIFLKNQDKIEKDILNENFLKIKSKNMKEYINKILESFKKICSIKENSKNIEEVYIEKALEYIKQNYNKDINMAVVSNYVSLNYSYFSTIFKKHLEMNFLDYLNKIRIEKAKEYLKRVDYKIYEIAEEVGYKNPKHFSKIFKKIEKITPIEYRLRYKEEGEIGDDDEKD